MGVEVPEGGPGQHRLHPGEGGVPWQLLCFSNVALKYLLSPTTEGSGYVKWIIIVWGTLKCLPQIPSFLNKPV